MKDTIVRGELIRFYGSHQYYLCPFAGSAYFYADCKDLCGSVWPEIINKDHDIKVTTCPCNYFGKKEAIIKLMEYLGND